MNKKGKDNSNYRHGHNLKGFVSPTYRTWCAMKNRCGENGVYKKVTFCKRWSVFKNFLEDMGERPEGKTLDRIDNSKGYSPENCRWATSSEQQRNRRDTRKVFHNGEEKLLVEYAEESGISHTVIRRRLERGWELKRALETPVRKYHV